MGINDLADWDYLTGEALAVLKSRAKGRAIIDIEEKALDLAVLYLEYDKKPDSTPFRLMWSLSNRLNYLPPLQLEEDCLRLERDPDTSCAGDTFLSSFTFRHLFFMWGQLAALSCTTSREISRVNEIIGKYIKPRSISCDPSALNCNYSGLEPEHWIKIKMSHLDLEPLDSYCIFEWGITSTSDTDFFYRHGLPKGQLLKTVDL